MEKFAAGVVDTGVKFAAGVVDTDGNFAAGVIDTDGKFVKKTKSKKSRDTVPLNKLFIIQQLHTRTPQNDCKVYLEHVPVVDLFPPLRFVVH